MAAKASINGPKGEPTTMAELLAAYGGKSQGLRRGQKVVGRVVEKTSNSLILDIGGKAEGVVVDKAFIEARGYIKSLQVGDEVHAEVLIPETPDGTAILSLRQTASESSWEKLEAATKASEPVKVQVRSVSPAGFGVEVLGLSGFIPASHLGKVWAGRADEEAVGKYVQALVIQLDRDTNRIVLSEKAVSEAAQIKAAKEAVEALKEGDVYPGTVTTVTDFGCFVKLVLSGKTEPEGLVHVSEISWEKTEKPSDKVKVGDKVKVKVLGVHGGKVSLSIKQAQEDPWENIEETFALEDTVKGKVVKQSDFGVFVQLIPGVEGLLHMTKIPPGKRLLVGDKVDVIVEEIDTKARKIALGLVLTEKPVGYK